MSLAVLATAPFTDVEQSTWSFSHAAHHRDIIRRVYATKSKQLQEYALDPFDPQNMDNWLEHHQQMHEDMTQALGIAGYILSEVDWSNPEARENWVRAHFDEHFRAGKILGIG